MLLLASYFYLHLPLLLSILISTITLQIRLSGTDVQHLSPSVLYWFYLISLSANPFKSPVYLSELIKNIIQLLLVSVSTICMHTTCSPIHSISWKIRTFEKQKKRIAILDQCILSSIQTRDIAILPIYIKVVDIDANTPFNRCIRTFSSTEPCFFLFRVCIDADTDMHRGMGSGRGRECSSDVTLWQKRSAVCGCPLIEKKKWPSPRLH